MDTDELACKLIEHVERKVASLNDQDYIEVLQEVASVLDTSVVAKQEELRQG